MRIRLRPCLPMMMAFVLVTIPSGLLQAQSNAVSTNVLLTAPEHYLYEVVPKGKQGPRESFAVRFLPSSNRITCIREQSGTSYYENAVLLLSADGRLLSGELRQGMLTNPVPNWVSTISVTSNSLTITLTRGDKRSSPKSYSISPSQDVAADISNLMLLRDFVASGECDRNITIADFAERMIEARLERMEKETVTVPAGTFECRKVVLSIDLLLFSFRMTYWVTEASPHYLIKYEGRRSLFGTVYETYLTAPTQTNAPPATHFPVATNLPPSTATSP